MGDSVISRRGLQIFNEDSVISRTGPQMFNGRLCYIENGTSNVYQKTQLYQERNLKCLTEDLRAWLFYIINALEIQTAGIRTLISQMGKRS